MNSIDLLAYGPASNNTSCIAISACRAGALGIVNAELGASVDELRISLDIISDPIKGARAPFGVKLATLDQKMLKFLTPYVSQGLTHLIVDEIGLNSFLSKANQKLPNGLKLWAELTGRTSPSWIKELDGIVLKGNEAGGYVGEESAFILFQHWRALTDKPIVIRGGMTPHSAAACRALGATGVAFDSQLLLMPEAQIPAPVAALISSMSGTETTTIGDPSAGRYFRILQHPRCKASKDLISAKGFAPIAEVMRAVSSSNITWSDPATDLLPLGQDAAFAKPFLDTYGSISNLFNAVRDAVATYPAIAAAAAPIRKNSALAQDISTQFPIIQGPMTRVSDNAEFAASVAKEGALPMLALAVMRPAQVDSLLEETAKRLGDMPWGVGFLGFLPAKTLDAQIEVALKHKPNYAIIAGGRPDQAVALEAKGIPSYLHVPSARLLGYFMENGARRFIFEGRECGGHIGPMSSFTIWSMMIDQILIEVKKQKLDPSTVHCIFAGGIHDAFSSALLQVMLAPLIECGVRLGVVIGTGYVYTNEIVNTGAVLSGFQNTMINVDDTVALTTGPGHASRCVRTPFVDNFFSTQQNLNADKTVPDDSKREILDDMILGTLRAASKGQIRAPKTGELQEIDAQEQYDSGMFMIGQVASLRHKKQSISDLHGSVTADAQVLLDSASQSEETLNAPVLTAAETPADIAIVGLSCALPGAMNADRFWANIIGKEDSITEIPKHRWDWRLYFDEDRAKKDKIYSRWGGFLEDMPFDPMRYGITPKSLKSVDPMQLMTLNLADEALSDSGYSNMNAALRARTSVVLGASGGNGDVGLQFNLRSEFPRFAGDLPEGLASELPEWSEDTFAGILINVLSGRVSNRLDLGGANFTTDAACASSLAALYQAMNELSSGRSDMAIAGGVDTQQSPFGFMCFAQTGALSATGRCQSFDKSADGIAISEGIVMFVLKRLEDAEAAGDRIYSVIKGIGAGSDGKAKALNAPEPKGQLRAMKRAYDQAGYSAASVRLFEAHGTGTVAGDTAELTSTGQLVQDADVTPRSAVIGSVKTNIGHTKATAGLAGLLKIVLSLHHGVLPPHRGVKDPNDVITDKNAPFYMLNEAEPWLTAPGQPRRSSVSAFGFGGTNFHATIEGYEGEYRDHMKQVRPNIMPAELVVLDSVDIAGLSAIATDLIGAIEANASLELRDISAASLRDFDASSPVRVSFVARDMQDLKSQLSALAAHANNASTLPETISLTTTPADPGKVAILFPGQGSQYPFMGREMAVWFKEVADALSIADVQLQPQISKTYGDDTTLSHFIYPRSIYTPAQGTAARQALTATDIAQPALGAVEAGLWDLLSSGFGLKGDMFAGHSYGEFTAHYGAGALNIQDLLSVSHARGSLIVEKAAEAGGELGTMLAVQADRSAVEAVVVDFRDAVVANHNAPNQVIVSGTHSAIEAAKDAFEAKSISVQSIPVSAAFHSPLMAPAKDALAKVVENLDWKSPAGAVYSNQHAAPHDANPRDAMVSHLVSPVNFVDQVKAMHDAGARTFVEVGPKATLSRLVSQILDGKEHKTVAVDGKANEGLVSFLSALGQLAIAGVALDFARLLQGRDCVTAGLQQLATTQRGTPMSKHAWWVNGSAVWSQKQDRPMVGVSADQPSLIAKAALTAPAPDSSATSAPSSAITSAAASRPVATSYKPMNRPVQKTYSKLERNPMYNREINPASSDTYSPAVSYYELVARSLDLAHEVALAELGVAPSARTHEQASAPAPRASHKRVPSRPVPTMTAQAVVSAPVAAAQPAPVQVPTAPVAAPVAAPVVTTAPAKDTYLDAAGLRALLLKTVSEKTGYDEDMVEFDQNLEADLGIDSIKRIDVVAGMMKALPATYETSLGDTGRTKLSTSGTLQEMLDQLVSAGSATANFNLAGAGKTTPVSEESTSNEATLLRPNLTTRFVVKPMVQPASASLSRGLTKGTFVVLPSASPVTKSLCAAIEKAGQQVEVVSENALLDEASFTAWCVENAQRLGSVAGIIHLCPLSATPMDLSKSNPEIWQSELFRNEKSIFLALKHLKLAPNGHAVSVSALGGLFARKNTAPAALTLAGGAVGLLKSYVKEETVENGVRARAIDLDKTLSVDELCDQIMDEMVLRGGRVEVGYPKGERHIFTTIDAAIPDKLVATNDTRPTPKVVLATGGARGITAETLRSIAGPDRVFVLTGRSAMPTEKDALRTDVTFAAMTSEQALAKHFMKSEKLPLGKARQRANKVIAAREMLDNVADFKAAGVSVEYVAVDVTNDKALKKTITSVTKSHGPIDTIVHGAGVIEDKYLADITSESWDRVVRTKVIGLLLLLKHLDVSALKSVVIYSSVAGRYGNAGQTSYATGNELMNRLACQMQRQLGADTFVRAMNWGPWGATKFGAGMVTAATEEKFRKQGVSLVSAQQGRDLFHHAVQSNVSNDDVEIICGSAPWEQTEVAQSKFVGTNDSGAVRGLQFAKLPREISSDTLEQDITIYKTAPFLNDHKIDGIPVLPMAMAIEMMAQSVSNSFGNGWKVIAVQDARLFNGLQVGDDAHDMIVRMVQKSHGMGETQTVAAKLFSANAAKRPHYVAEFVLAPSFTPSIAANLTKVPTTAQAFSKDAIYPEHLFHGPAFQVMTNASGIWTSNMRAEIATAHPDALLGNAQGMKWLVDPLLVDAIFQMPLVWASVEHDVSILPLQFERIECFTDMSNIAKMGHVTLDMKVTEQDANIIRSEILAIAPDGQVVMAATGMSHAIRAGARSKSEQTGASVNQSKTHKITGKS